MIAKKNIRGWFSVNPYKRTNIYETDRQTNEVGIYEFVDVSGNQMNPFIQNFLYQILEENLKFNIFKWIRMVNTL